MENFINKSHCVQRTGGNTLVLLIALLEQFVHFFCKFSYALDICKNNIAAGSVQLLVKVT